VYATTRSAERAAAFAARGWTPVRWDVLAGGEPLPATDAAVYAVGHDRSLGVPMAELYVGGVRRTVHAMPATGMIAYVSSTGVYGDAAGAWVDEATPPAPVDESGRVCWEAEQAFAAAADHHGQPWCVLRAAGIYGPGRMIGVEALRRGTALPGDPAAYLNLIHVEDLAAALDLAVRRADHGSTLCVSDGKPPTRAEFYGDAARALGVPPPRFDGSAARRQRGNRRVRNDALRALGMAFAHPDHRAGLAALLAK
jgi:nucleoside-diphosphate-sugar epimerase